MDIYDIYETEKNKLQDTKAVLKKIEAKNEQELRKEIETLLRNSLKEFYAWAMSKVANLPELVELIKSAIALEAEYDAKNEDDGWTENISSMYIDIFTSNVVATFYVLDCTEIDCTEKFTSFDIPEFESADYDTFKQLTGCTINITLMPKVKNRITFEFYDEVENSEESSEKKVTYQILQQLADELSCNFEDNCCDFSWNVLLNIHDFNGFNF